MSTNKVGFALAASALLVVNRLCVNATHLPSFVCLTQLASTAVFVLVLSAASVVRTHHISASTAISYMPWVFAFVATMYSSMMALQTTNVDTVIGFRCLSPLFISILEWAFMDRELPSMRSWVAIIVMLSSALLNAYFVNAVSGLNSMHSYIWVSANVLCDVVSSLIGRDLVENNVKLQVWDHVLYTNLLSLPPMLAAGLAGREHVVAQSMHYDLTAVGLVALSCFLAVGVSYFSWRAREELSASAFSMLSAGTKIGATAASRVIWHQETSIAGSVSVVVCIIASLFFVSPPHRSPEKGTATDESAPITRRSFLILTRRDLSVAMVVSIISLGLATLTGKSQLMPDPNAQRLMAPAAGLDGAHGHDAWATALIDEFRARKHAAIQTGAASRFPLASDTLEAAELIAMADTMLSGKLTMGSRVDRFERQLEEYLHVPCAVMVNSGSSANLIAVAGAIELSGMGKLGRGVDGLRRGDEVLVPALAWSTTLAPLVQLGARPVLVDVLPDTLNMDVSAAAAKITSEFGALYRAPFWSMSTVHPPATWPRAHHRCVACECVLSCAGKTRAIMLVHALGNSVEMQALMNLADKHRLVVIEDVRSSLPSCCTQPCSIALHWPFRCNSLPLHYPFISPSLALQMQLSCLL